ncbi:MAG: hypothetical protein HY076_07195 [Candidatus Eisenbacteria bacterium]|uniref:Uncharacterized protein n=1 Tax=Eiseniibacteriota bacterium TaxID=2212470 RepID=A0A9D6L566_UNCEI|nr:hypothetical protein [Candidatus Eisenbacteria bacterium]MBI3540042.1 hypothetical protein [Candidatus Eisenbacteria bacterium]
MKNMRWFVPSLTLAALMATGCFLISGQFLIHFDLGNVNVVASGVDGVGVDLNTVKDYSKHKDNLKDLADIAILGTFVNTGVNDIDVEVWLVDEATPSLTTPGAVMAGGVRAWGPFKLKAGTSHTITWDESAVLFGAGKAPLLAQIKGDGIFTLYALTQSGAYAFQINNGKLIAVIDVAAS